MRYRSIMAQKDRRKNKKRTIANLSGLLNYHQMSALNYVESGRRLIQSTEHHF